MSPSIPQPDQGGEPLYRATGTGRPYGRRPVSRIRGSAIVRQVPTVRGVVLLRLPTWHGSVSTPKPTTEHGGILPYPPGTLLRIDIGDARSCDEWTAASVAGAVCDCADIEILGTDPEGVAATRAAFTRAISRVTAARNNRRVRTT